MSKVRPLVVRAGCESVAVRVMRAVRNKLQDAASTVWAWGQTEIGDTVILAVMCAVLFGVGWRLCWELWARGVFR